MEYRDDWMEKQDQELKDKNECGGDNLCIMCKEFETCNGSEGAKNEI